MAQKFIRKDIPLRARKISLLDIKRIFERLSLHLEEEAERQTQALVRPAKQAEAGFKEQVAVARKNAFRITVTISGSDGQDLFGDTSSIFESPNVPDEIAYIYIQTSPHTKVRLVGSRQTRSL